MDIATNVSESMPPDNIPKFEDGISISDYMESIGRGTKKTRQTINLGDLPRLPCSINKGNIFTEVDRRASDLESGSRIYEHAPDVRFREVPMTQTTWAYEHAVEGGNNYFTAVALAVYGHESLWFWVRQQHHLWYDSVIKCPHHPRRDLYERFSLRPSFYKLKDKFAIPDCWIGHEDLQQVTADLYSIFLVVHSGSLVDGVWIDSTFSARGSFSAPHRFLRCTSGNDYKVLKAVIPSDDQNFEYRWPSLSPTDARWTPFLDVAVPEAWVPVPYKGLPDLTDPVHLRALERVLWANIVVYKSPKESVESTADEVIESSAPQSDPPSTGAAPEDQIPDSPQTEEEKKYVAPPRKDFPRKKLPDTVENSGKSDNQSDKMEVDPNPTTATAPFAEAQNLPDEPEEIITYMSEIVGGVTVYKEVRVRKLEALPAGAVIVSRKRRAPDDPLASTSDEEHSEDEDELPTGLQEEPPVSPYYKTDWTKETLKAIRGEALRRGLPLARGLRVADARLTVAVEINRLERAEKAERDAIRAANRAIRESRRRPSQDKVAERPPKRVKRTKEAHETDSAEVSAGENASDQGDIPDSPAASTSENSIPSYSDAEAPEPAASPEVPESVDSEEDGMKNETEPATGGECTTAASLENDESETHESEELGATASNTPEADDQDTSPQSRSEQVISADNDGASAIPEREEQKVEQNEDVDMEGQLDEKKKEEPSGDIDGVDDRDDTATMVAEDVAGDVAGNVVGNVVEEIVEHAPEQDENPACPNSTSTCAGQESASAEPEISTQEHPDQESATAAVGGDVGPSEALSDSTVMKTRGGAGSIGTGSDGTSSRAGSLAEWQSQRSESVSFGKGSDTAQPIKRKKTPPLFPSEYNPAAPPSWVAIPSPSGYFRDGVVIPEFGIDRRLGVASVISPVGEMEIFSARRASVACANEAEPSPKTQDFNLQSQTSGTSIGGSSGYVPSAFGSPIPQQHGRANGASGSGSSGYVPPGLERQHHGSESSAVQDIYRLGHPEGVAYAAVASGRSSEGSEHSSTFDQAFRPGPVFSNIVTEQQASLGVSTEEVTDPNAGGEEAACWNWKTGSNISNASVSPGSNEKFLVETPDASPVDSLFESEMEDEEI